MIIGHRLNGHGPNRVMFLHGWFGDSSSWSTVDHLLPDDQYTKAFLDYRGYGLSRDQKGQYTIEEIGEDTLALADHLGWDTFSAVGHSIGGKVVQKLAATAAARLHRIVAVTPVPAAAVPFDDATWNLFQSAATNPESRAGIIGLTTGNRLLPSWVNQTVAYSLKTSNVDAFAAYLTAWARTDFAASVQGSKVPLHVVVGQHDAAVTADGMRGTLLAWFPNSSMISIGEAGHYPMDETPVLLATIIDKFVGQS